MNYLVVRPKKQFCEIVIFDNEETEIDLPYEVWALRTGKQILFVNNKMAHVLKGYHLHGTYQNGATHACSYEEMVAIMSDLLGPTDQERYEEAAAAHNEGYRLRSNGRALFASYFAVEAGGLAVRVMWMGLKFLGLMLILPFLIHMLSKRR